MTLQTTLSAMALLALALTATSTAMAQTSATNLPWCGIVDDDLECVYATLQECERWMQADGQACTPNPGSGQND